VEERVIVYCAQRGSHWHRDVETPKCAADEHLHRPVRVHLHRDEVTLPNGVAVTGVSFDPAGPYRRDHMPQYGLYLDERWRPPWPAQVLAWPDFGVPGDKALLQDALRVVLQHASAGEVAEIGCVGGHGRTGTALACLVILTGISPASAVDWVRRNYCPQAIETAAQREFVLGFGAGP
jgi:Protein-tyrosine phosphatase